jgi:hypothetical protein
MCSHSEAERRSRHVDGRSASEKDTPMKLVAKTGRNGSMIASAEGILFLFDRKTPQPANGETVEAMITRACALKWDGSLGALVGRQVGDGDILVRHNGFVRGGLSNVTTAWVDADDAGQLAEAAGGTVCWLLGGSSPVVKAVNGALPTPGRAYVSKVDLAAGHRRICGVPDLASLDPDVVARLIACRKAARRACVKPASPPPAVGRNGDCNAHR